MGLLLNVIPKSNVLVGKRKVPETQRDTKETELQAEMKHSNEPTNVGIVSSRRDRGGKTSLSEFQEEPILLVS